MDGTARLGFAAFLARQERKLPEAVERTAAQVLDAAIEVHRHLGPGHPERVYEKALCVELDLRGTPFKRQHPIRLTYKGVDVGDSYCDLLVADHVVVELKHVEALTDVFRAQTASYLVGLNLELGLLINFNVPRLVEGFRRVIRSKQ